MKKRYYVYYPRNFSNEYRLVWAANGQPVPDGYERTTRKQAFHLAREERERRRYNVNMSGYADCFIFPLAIDFSERQYINRFYRENADTIWEEGYDLIDRFIIDYITLPF